LNALGAVGDSAPNTPRLRGWRTSGELLVSACGCFPACDSDSGPVANSIGDRCGCYLGVMLAGWDPAQSTTIPAIAADSATQGCCRRPATGEEVGRLTATRRQPDDPLQTCHPMHRSMRHRRGAMNPVKLMCRELVSPTSGAERTFSRVGFTRDTASRLVD